MPSLISTRGALMMNCPSTAMAGASPRRPAARRRFLKSDKVTSVRFTRARDLSAMAEPIIVRPVSGSRAGPTQIWKRLSGRSRNGRRSASRFLGRMRPCRMSGSATPIARSPTRKSSRNREAQCARECRPGSWRTRHRQIAPHQRVKLRYDHALTTERSSMSCRCCAAPHGQPQRCA